MKVLLISGKAEAGKDFTATIIKEQMESLNKSVLIVHYADYLKFIAKQYFGWSGLKDQEGRNLLQQLGTNKIRARRPDFWVDTVIHLLEVIGDDFDFILIPDCRFRNEIRLAKQAFNAVSINVVRIDHENSLTEEQRKHPSETDLDGFVFDYVLESRSGRENLEKEINKFIKEVL